MSKGATRNAICSVVLVALGLGGSACREERALTLKLADGVEMKVVRILPGKFVMGSPADEKGHDEDERQLDVTISKPFYMGQTHVTVDQFAAFVKDTGYETDAEKAGSSLGFEIHTSLGFLLRVVDGASWRNPSFDQKGDHPVVQVSWNDATAFCDWLSTKSAKTVRLPTEAEWEYACRAGTKTAYPWGDNPDDGKEWANCADQTLKKKLPYAPARLPFFSWEDGFAFTSPAGTFKANAFGLHDMIGNAWQWCADWYGDYDKGAVVDPTGANVSERRVLRGGSWLAASAACRLAVRGKDDPTGRHSDDCGFRVVVSASID